MSSSAPRLSSDVGAMIFELLLTPPPLTERGWEEPDFSGCKSTFAVSHVCREWRHIACSHGFLWSRIALDASGGRTLDDEYLQTLVDRSRRAPIQIRLTFDAGGLRQESAWILEPLLDRVVTMHIILTEGASFQSLLDCFHDCQPSTSLERLRITTPGAGTCPWPQELDHYVPETIKELYVPGWLSHYVWPREELTSMEIGDERFVVGGLEHYKKLTRLAVWSRTSYGVEELIPFTPSAASRLKYLFCNNPRLVTMAGPPGFANLEELAIHHPLTLPPFPPMPVLRTLRLSYLLEMPETILATFALLPSIQVLVLAHSQVTFDLDLKWSRDAYIHLLPRLHTLVIEEAADRFELDRFDWVVSGRADLGGVVTPISTLRRIACEVDDERKFLDLDGHFRYGKCMNVHKMSF